MDKKIKNILIYLSFFIISIIVFLPVLLDANNNLIWGDDVHRQYYFYREFINIALKSGQLPLWNPYYFSGAPFLGNAIVNIWYPPNWTYIFLPLNYAFPIHLIFHISWAMIGVYILSRIFFDKSSSYAAGILFGLSGFFMSRTWAGHMDVLAAASFMPWTIWSIIKIFKSEKKDKLSRFILSVIIFSFQLLSGYQTMSFFTLEVAFIITLIYSFIFKNIKPIITLILVAFFSVGLSAFQIFPVNELFTNSIRTFSFPYEWISAGSSTFESLLGLFNPFYFGDQNTYHGPPPNYHESSAYIGKIGLILFILSILVFIKLNIEKIIKNNKLNILEFGFIISMILACIFSIWVSLGPNAYIDLQKILWKFIPMYHFLRFPPRHMVIFAFTGACLAAFTLSTIKYRVIKTLIVISIIIELYLFGSHFIYTNEPPNKRHDQKLINILKPIDNNLFRFLPNFGVWINPRDSLDADSSMSYGLYNATGYDPTIVRSYYEFIDATLGNQNPSILNTDVQVPYMNVYSNVLNYLNIRYILLPTNDSQILESNGRFNLAIKDDTKGYKLFQNNLYFPRFFIVNNANYYNSKSDVYKVLAMGFNDFQNTVLLVGNKIHKSNCGDNINSSKVEIVEYKLNYIKLIAKSSCNSFLVSSEVMFPGWTARVNGINEEILSGNYTFRTIKINKGENIIEMQYFPKSLYVGLIITGLSIVILLLITKFNRKYNFICYFLL